MKLIFHKDILKLTDLYCTESCSKMAKNEKNKNLQGLQFLPLQTSSHFVQCALDLRKILGVAKKFLKSRSFLFQTQQNP